MSVPVLPRPTPDTEKLEGRFVDLEKFDLARHGAELWESIGAHDELWMYIPSGPFADKAAWMDYLRDRSMRAGSVFFAVRDKASGKCTALYMLLKLAPEMGTAEIGLVYGAALRRSAAGTEAFFLLADYVLGTLGYRRLEWRCSPEHEGSRRAAARYGFREEGTLRQTMWAKDHNWDTVMHSIIDGEWPAVSGRFAAWLNPRNFDAEGQQIKALSAFG